MKCLDILKYKKLLCKLQTIPTNQEYQKLHALIIAK